MPITTQDQKRLTSYTNQSRKQQVYTNQKLESALQRAVTALNITGPLAMARYQSWASSNNEPHAQTFIARYGRWSDALKAAGLPSRVKNKREGFSAEDCVEGLLAARGILGWLPSLREYEKLWRTDSRIEPFPSPATVRLKLKTWQRACTEASTRIK